MKKSDAEHLERVHLLYMSMILKEEARARGELMKDRIQGNVKVKDSRQVKREQVDAKKDKNKNEDENTTVIVPNDSDKDVVLTVLEQCFHTETDDL